MSHVSVEAISAVVARAHARWFRRIRTVRIDGRPAPTAGALAGACGQAASHPRIGGRAAPFPVPSERASVGIRKRRGEAHPARIRPAPEAARLVRVATASLVVWATTEAISAYRGGAEDQASDAGNPAPGLTTANRAAALSAHFSPFIEPIDQVRHLMRKEHCQGSQGQADG